MNFGQNNYTFSKAESQVTWTSTTHHPCLHLRPKFLPRK